MGMFVRVGGVVLSGFETPQELPGIGTRQQIVRHEFPGGEITIQPLGAFPHTVAWTGILTGRDAFPRAQRLQRLAALALSTTLSWGPWAWRGVVADFEAKAKHAFYVPYSLRFEPSRDLSGIGTVAGPGVSVDNVLGDGVTAIQDLQDGADGLALPGSLAAPAAALLSSISVGLLQGNGSLQGISVVNASTIAAAAAAVQVASIDLQGGDAATAAPAFGLGAQAAILGSLVGSPVRGVRVVRTVNPNLFRVAAQYLGDATRWGDIAALSGLSDPQPVGQYDLTVPLQ